MKKQDVPFELMCETECSSHIAIAAVALVEKQHPKAKPDELYALGLDQVKKMLR